LALLDFTNLPHFDTSLVDADVHNFFSSECCADDNIPADLEVVVDHTMSGKKYMRDGYAVGLNGSLMMDSTADRHQIVDSPSGNVEGLGEGSDNGFAIHNMTITVPTN
jgi:hypothetical protein